MTHAPHFSLVLETPPADPRAAERFFVNKLSVETDAADVAADLQKGVRGFMLFDVRSPKAYEECHIPGAINAPVRQLTAERLASMSPDELIVVYCWGPGCNGATKAAARLAALGYKVKEMIGGLEYWRREGHPVEGTLASAAALVG